jgi:hypothetical protein
VQLASLAAMAASEWTASKLPPRPPDPERGTRPGPDWHALDPEAVMAELATGPTGLDAAGAWARAATLTEAEDDRRPGVLQLLVSELTNPLTAVLGAGAALSAATGSLVDAGLIGGVIGLDASVGVVQRLRTEAPIPSPWRPSSRPDQPRLPAGQLGDARRRRPGLDRRASPSARNQASGRECRAWPGSGTRRIPYAVSSAKRAVPNQPLPVAERSIDVLAGHRWQAHGLDGLGHGATRRPPTGCERRGLVSSKRHGRRMRKGCHYKEDSSKTSS